MASGAVDFPDYMKEVHEDWMRQSADVVTSSITDLINAAVAASPYDSKTAYDPTTNLNAMSAAVTALNSRVDAIDPDGDWAAAVTAAETAFDGVIDTDFYDDQAEEFYNYMNDTLDNTIIPTFKGGMRDVNAVMSSAFVIGESVIRAFALRDANKYLADIKQKMQMAKVDSVFKGAERIIQSQLAQVELEKAVTHYTMEVNRMTIASEKDETDGNLAIAIGQEKWAFDAYQYGANVLAAISGGTSGANTGASAPSSTQSAIAGALAGAAMGSQISGNWQGGAIGGIIGLGLSLLN